MKRNRQFLIQSIQQQWTCPITSMPMIDPVSTIDGHTYQRREIVQWLNKQQTSPKTGLSLSKTQIVPNIVLKNVINKFQNQIKYQFTKIQQENYQLTQKVQKFQLTIKDLKKQKNQLQKQYKNNYTTLLNTQKKINQNCVQLKKENQNLKKENQDLKKNNEFLGKLNHTLKKQSKQSKQCVSTKIQNQKLKTIIQKTQDQSKIIIKQLQATLNSRNQQLHILKSQNTNLKTDVNAVKAQNNALKTQVNMTIRLRDENQSLKINNEKQAIQIRQVQKQANLIQIENNNLRKEIKQVSQRNDKLVIQNQRFKKMYHQSEDKVKNMETLLAQKAKWQQENQKNKKIEEQKLVNQYNTKINFIHQKINNDIRLMNKEMQIKVNKPSSLQPRKNINMMQQQSPYLKHFLPLNDYLFNHPVLYDQHKQQLDHSAFKINIQQFIKYDWTHLKTLNLSDTQLDDKGIQVLVNQAIYFTNLENIWLWNNLIVNLPKFAFQRFKKLRTLFFSLKGRLSNPLNQESKKYLKSLQIRNSHISISYQNKTQ